VGGSNHAPDHAAHDVAVGLGVNPLRMFNGCLFIEVQQRLKTRSIHPALHSVRHLAGSVAVDNLHRPGVILRRHLFVHRLQEPIDLRGESILFLLRFQRLGQVVSLARDLLENGSEVVGMSGPDDLAVIDDERRRNATAWLASSQFTAMTPCRPPLSAATL
jgi:hypothetical protein